MIWNVTLVTISGTTIKGVVVLWALLEMFEWDLGSFSKVVVAFNHVSGSLKLNLFKYYHQECLNI